MASPDYNRVLCRQGARELTATEVEFVSGAQIVHTNVCSAVGFNIRTQTVTGGDGDGCSDYDYDFS